MINIVKLLKTHQIKFSPHIYETPLQPHSEIFPLFLATTLITIYTFQVLHYSSHLSNNLFIAILRSIITFLKCIIDLKRCSSSSRNRWFTLCLMILQFSSTITFSPTIHLCLNISRSFDLWELPTVITFNNFQIPIEILLLGIQQRCVLLITQPFIHWCSRLTVTLSSGICEIVLEVIFFRR